MTHMGLSRVNDRATYIADTRGVPTWHCNDSIFSYRLDCSMVDQIDRRQEGHDIYHESSHSMLIFRINDCLPKLRVRSLSLPETEEDKEKFKEKVAEYLNNSPVQSMIDSMYEATEKACVDLRL